MAHTGQSDAIHSPEECANIVVRLTIPAVRSSAVVWTVAISCCPKVLRTMSSPLDSGAYRKVCSVPLGPSPRIVATSDFSGLTNSPWALAKAAANVPIEGLDRCMAASLSTEGVKADGSRFGPLGPHTVSDRLLGVLRHQALELSLSLLVLEKSRPGPREDRCKLPPGIG